jgi:hypothetical protein
MLRWSDLGFVGRSLKWPARRQPQPEAAAEATVARLQSARERVRRTNPPAASQPAQPAAPEPSPTAPRSAPQQPPPGPKKPKPAPARPRSARSDETLANLLAARQRARRNQKDQSE